MNCLLNSIDKIHTTEQGIKRLRKNLKIDGDAVAYCKDLIMQEDCEVTRRGKNFYANIGNVQITINAYSYTIITAHGCAKKD